LETKTGVVNNTERITRKDQIDPALVAAGWEVDDTALVGLEVPVDGYDKEPWNGVTDYVLHQPDGQIIAVVEAKRNSRNPQVAREQVRHYVKEIGKRQTFVPFAFLANGKDIYFWDVGSAAPCPV
jgi:type I site-specific restriction endonuclease